MRRRKSPIPAVVELVNLGLLHPTDAEWIGRLKPESQLASALKCGRPSPTFAIQGDAKSSITHGHPSTMARRTA